MELGNLEARSKILEALKNGTISSNCTAETLSAILQDDEIKISEYQLLISVVGSDKYEVEVKQGNKVIADPESDGYAVLADKKIKVTVTSGKKELTYSYVANDNKNIEFNFNDETATEK